MNAKLENNDNKREEEEEEVEAQADEGIQLEPGCGFVLCTGGAKGTDQLAEELALQYGVKVEVLIPPGHPRRHTVTPLHPRVLTLANSYLEAAATKLKKSLPTQNYVLHLLQRNFEIVRRADTVYAFGILEDDCQRVRGALDGQCRWPWIWARKSMCVTQNPKSGFTPCTVTDSRGIVWTRGSLFSPF